MLNLTSIFSYVLISPSKSKPGDIAYNNCNTEASQQVAPTLTKVGEFLHLSCSLIKSSILPSVKTFISIGSIVVCSTK